MKQPLLSVQNLKKYYPIRGGILFRQIARTFAVDDVSFDVFPGETLGLVGESGCGKSTVAKTLLRLHEPASGKVIFDGKEILGMDKDSLRTMRKAIQIVFQDPVESLNPRQTVGAILEEPFVIHDTGTVSERKKWIRELLEQVGLQPDAVNRYPHEFSGGQRQRIGIARAIALKPKLLVCDEPVSALDVSIQSQILNLLHDLQRELDLTLIFIAHDLSVVKHVSDRIAVMYLGKIVEIGEAGGLYEKPLHPYTRALINAIPVPDPAAKSRFNTLEGEVPSPMNPPSGCYFHTRCPNAQERCKSDLPELNSVKLPDESLRDVACHYAEDFLHD